MVITKEDSQNTRKSENTRFQQQLQKEFPQERLSREGPRLVLDLWNKDHQRAAYIGGGAQSHEACQKDREKKCRKLDVP